MKNILYALIILIPAYLAYGWRGVFWVVVVFALPVTILFTSLAVFTNSMWGKLMKEHHDKYKEIEKEVEKILKNP